MSKKPGKKDKQNKDKDKDKLQGKAAMGAGTVVNEG